MHKTEAAGRLTTAASSRPSETALSGIDHKALARAKTVQFENSTRLANDESLSDSEREHHALIAHALASR